MFIILSIKQIGVKMSKDLIINQKLKVDKPNFKVDMFEELILQDRSNFDEDLRIKLNRNLTEYFRKWLYTKLKQKEQVKINIRGETRSGKSLVGIRILQMINEYYNYPFNPEYQICANQKEYRLNIQSAEFGMPFQVDENAFNRSGVGSMSEALQLKDIQNITAKKNIHTIFITPESFLPTGATIGLVSFGKDLNNYLSRFLIYSIKNGITTLMGYVIFNIGLNYQNEGCYIYKQLGGCNNVNKIKTYEIDKELLSISDCIHDDYKTEDKLKELEEQNLKSKEYRCPFYNICKSGMCVYEKKKDKWIERELKGELDERELEKLRVSIELFKKLSKFNGERFIPIASKRKELTLKVKLNIPKITNTKFVEIEKEEMVTILETFYTDEEFLKDVCKNLNINIDDLYDEIINKE